MADSENVFFYNHFLLLTLRSIKISGISEHVGCFLQPVSFGNDSDDDSINVFDSVTCSFKISLGNDNDKFVHTETPGKFLTYRAWDDITFSMPFCINLTACKSLPNKL